MLGDPFSYLTEGQKACLRLVSQGMSSKEIARQLHLTPLTVDTYLKAAIARLGATNRREAARRLYEAELSQKSGSPPPALVSSSLSIEQLLPTQPGEQRGIEATGEGEDGIDSRPEASLHPSRWSWRLPPIGGRQHDLNISETLAQIAKVAVAAALVTSAIVALTEGAMRLLSN